jgi:hypothetical protein
MRALCSFVAIRFFTSCYNACVRRTIKMHIDTQLLTKLKKAKKPRVVQQARTLFVMLLLVLFSLSSCTVAPNTGQALNLTTDTTLPLTFHTRATLTRSTNDDICTDVVSLAHLSSSEIKIFFSDCALQRLSVLATNANAVAALLAFVLSGCPDCQPIANGIAALVAWITANIANLEYVSQECGDQGAFLDMNWSMGIQSEPVCSPSD